jgi:excinuclease ABC subunit C
MEYGVGHCGYERRHQGMKSSMQGRSAVARLPTTAGVYRFRDERGSALYVGRASDLRHRVASYWSDLGDRGHLARMVTRIARIEAVVCNSPHEAAWLERNLLERTMPPWNRTAGGQEVPVHIALHEGPQRPRLEVVHLVSPGPRRRHFGPYLGGARVRLAVAGLERILPLHYAGTGLTGSERDMAGQRGVGPADYGWLLDATVAVLWRNDDAVARAAAAFADLRDRAVDALAFESAARIQAEAEAVAWITSVQRVTAANASDIDVYGWADDVLVHFEIRNGRLDRWRQLRLTERAASDRVASTPPAWQEFARRNADLAAVLARP